MAFHYLFFYGKLVPMSIFEKIEDKKREENNIDINFPQYRFFTYEESEGEALEFKFSNKAFEDEKYFPDYICTREEAGEAEVWTVLHKDSPGEHEVQINGHNSREELAYKISNTYSSVRDHTS